MKRLFLLFAAFIMLGIAPLNAQTRAPASQSGAHVTKDGKPDRRFKENKTSAAEAKPAGPMKKDGTKDKRYKANKEVSKKK